MKLTRRSWFAALIAPFAARFLPKPAVAAVSQLDFETAYACALGTGLADIFFVDSPLMFHLRKHKLAETSGGTSIAQPLRYADGWNGYDELPDTLSPRVDEPVTRLTTHACTTIHNPLNLPVREDGANQCH